MAVMYICLLSTPIQRKMYPVLFLNILLHIGLDEKCSSWSQNDVASKLWAIISEGIHGSSAHHKVEAMDPDYDIEQRGYRSWVLIV